MNGRSGGNRTHIFQIKSLLQQPVFATDRKWCVPSESNRVVPLFRRVPQPCRPETHNGVINENRTHIAGFTAQCPNRWTMTTIKLAGSEGVEPSRLTPCPVFQTGVGTTPTTLPRNRTLHLRDEERVLQIPAHWPWEAFGRKTASVIQLSKNY